MYAPTPTLSHPAVPPSLRRTRARGPLSPATLAALRTMFEPPPETDDEADAAVARVMDAIRRATA
jgi:hypothetical protein